MKYSEILTYNNGIMLWKSRHVDHFTCSRLCNTWNSRFAGKVAGSYHRSGYIHVSITIDGVLKKQKAHRIIWEMHNGPIPDGMEIDHINGIKDDNRIENLRLATRSENRCNIPAHRNNTSGHKGVTWYKPLSKWLAQIKKDKKRYHLGYFDSIEEASSAYNAAAAELHKDFRQSRR